MRNSALRRRWRGRFLLLVGLILAGAAPARADSLRTITDVHVRGESVAIITSETGELSLTSFALDDPPRLVFDVDNVTLSPGLLAAQPVRALGLSQLRIGRRLDGSRGVRLVFDLERGAALPSWRTQPGQQPGETAIIFEAPRPVLLGQPSVEKRQESWTVRLPGAARALRHVDELDNPPRVYVDVANAAVAAPYRQSFPDSPFREIRMAARESEPAPTARLVVELAEPETYSAAVDGEDLVLSFGAVASAPKESTEKGRLAGRLIVVDPGHGGDDPGASSGDTSCQAREKDITLAIGLRLARLLRGEGAAVRMTRADDTFITLTERADLANRLKADAFISVHVNSCATPNTLHGTSVYYDHRNSVRLARLVQEELISALGTRDNSIRSANFSVIRRAQCPGILVETAFINHDGDRQLLTDPTSQEKAARAILEGVIRFFSAKSSSGSSDE